MSEQLKSTEIIQTKPERYSFMLLRPGGNDTALIGSKIPDDCKRKVINDSVMKIYPNIEQVGFVFCDQDGGLNLNMAGGEFCGNATRSLAYIALEGRPGDLKIKVSGVNGKLKAGVKDNGDAYAQMPVFQDTSKVVSDRDNPQAWLVEMEGITHYVVFQDSPLFFTDTETIKKEALDILDDKNMRRYPAAGVVYASLNDQGWRIDPVVYVRDIDTCFYESACGSGTTALGQVLAFIKQGAIKDVPVIQPSGKRINISVDLTDKGYEYAEISGQVQNLAQGVMKKDVTGAYYAVEKIMNQDELIGNLYPRQLIDLYQRVFGEPPYNEKFDPEEVASFFNEYYRKGTIVLAKDQGKIIGFAASVNLESETKVKQIVSDYGINVEDCAYIAELGIDSDYRRRKIGTGLMEELLMDLPGKISLLRTSKDNIRAQNLYKNLGFFVVPGMIESVRQKRTNGEEYEDERIFMIKNL
jgi:diaminopimelate epimerase/ribosomal protein S18 acetylase RimI-like enzyme